MTRLHPAIRTTYRISLRSSSLREPRYPLLRVLVIFSSSEYETPRNGFSIVFGVCVCVFPAERPRGRVLAGARVARGRTIQFAERIDHSNDPSAGSPTETLLRLLLPRWEGLPKFSAEISGDRQKPPIPTIHQHTQSVGATGGVYKGQGRNQRELMTRAY